MKKIFKLAALVAASLAIFSCTPDNGDGTGDGNGNGGSLNQDLTFTLGDPEVEATQVKVRVEHNGDKEDPWYYFVTTESDVDEAITAELKRIKEANEEVTLKKTTKTNVTVKDLTPETEYTLVVIGLTAEYEYYGTPASVKFKTAKEQLAGMTQTDDWKVSYKRGEYQEQTVELLTVECASNLTYYLTCVGTKLLEMDLSTYNMTIEDYALYLVEYDFGLNLEYGYSLDFLLETGTQTIPFNRMVVGDYTAFCIGFTPDGQATGYFSTQEFSVLEETATPEYARWLGTWKLTSAPYEYETLDPDTNEEITVTAENTFNIEIAHYDNNFKYLIYGWEEGENQWNDMTDLFGERIFFPASYAEGMVGFEGISLMSLGADGVSPGEEILFGLWDNCDLTYNGQLYQDTTVGIEGLTMAVAVTEDGTAGTIYGLEYNLAELVGPPYENVVYTGMSYLGIPLTQNVNWAIYNDYMRFPITMEKVDAPDMAKVPAAMKKACAKTNRPTAGLRMDAGKKLPYKPVREF